MRAYVESLGKGYVFTVPTSFIVTCADGNRTVKTLLGRVPAGGWSLRSCGAGCKGHRWYEWAWIATSSPPTGCWCAAPGRSRQGHVLLLPCPCRCHPGHPGPHRRAPLAGRDLLPGRQKSILGIDAHQVRLWHTWHRHTVLTLLAAAVLAVATAASAEGDSTAQPTRPDSDAEDGNVGASDRATAPPRHRYPPSPPPSATPARCRPDLTSCHPPA